MSLLDFFTGGNASDAKDALNKAKDIFAGLQTPTKADLTLPELQKYVQAGLMTPAQAQAALVSGNAYDQATTSSKPIESEMNALNKLQGVADAQGMTPEMKAQLTDALSQVKTQEQGANASVLDQMAARGIPTSLMGAAAEMANNGQQAESANKAATDAAGQAEQNALQALSQGGQMAGQIHGQQYQEAANKAAAANAINQWNAQNQTGVNVSNAANKQAANAYNTQNAQDISNQNTSTSNARTQYNAAVPQTVYQDALQKAQGQAGAFTNIGNLSQEQGKQNAGIWSGMINTATQFIPKPGMGGSGSSFLPQNPTEAKFDTQYKTNGFSEGGKVPGIPSVPGDSTQNDRVPALLSAGEVVVPRSIASHPELVKNFVANLMHKKVNPVHPDDVRSVLDALSQRRG